MALRDKQAAFVEHYLATFNASEAARLAGYSEKTAGAIGWNLLKKVEISDAISRRLQETAMRADEVLMRLADHARGSMGDFAKVGDDGKPYFDLKAAQEADRLHLVKKLKTKTRTLHLGKDDEDEPNTEDDEPTSASLMAKPAQGAITEVTIEFELYDAQAALVHLGKHHKLFKDGPTGAADDPIHIKMDV